MDIKELQSYRRLALDRLEQLLIQLPETPHEADYFVDRYIRILSNLPARPDNSLPYEGLYGSGSSLDQYRDVAADRLQELVENLPEIAKVDEEIDGYIRTLSDLSERPNDVQPYVSLFIIRTSEPDPIDIGVDSTLSAQKFINSQQLLQIAGTNTVKNRIEAFTPGVNATFEKYQINTNLRMAHFLAQVMHESGGFKWLRELWGPTAQQKSYEPPFSKARELGNRDKGDGFKYRGRGLIQLTGKYNYKKLTDEIGTDFNVDFVSQPNLVETTPYAVLAAGWYWDRNNINQWADQDDLRKVTKSINGGFNGLEDRRKFLKRAKLVLKV
ncbi:MAG: glycoside hydrolase family 19 protein [Cyanobacteria bacterium J06621_8]